jgi:hypothetical protein
MRGVGLAAAGRLEFVDQGSRRRRNSKRGRDGIWTNPAQPAEVKPQSRGNGLTAEW